MLHSHNWLLCYCNVTIGQLSLVDLKISVDCSTVGLTLQCSWLTAQSCGKSSLLLVTSLIFPLHPFRSPILLRIPSAILVLLAVPFSPSQACPFQSGRSTAAGAPLYLREHHSKMIKLKTAKREKCEILLKSLHNFCSSVSSYSPNRRKNIYL